MPPERVLLLPLTPGRPDARDSEAALSLLRKCTCVWIPSSGPDRVDRAVNCLFKDGERHPPSQMVAALHAQRKKGLAIGLSGFCATLVTSGVLMMGGSDAAACLARRPATDREGHASQICAFDPDGGLGFLDGEIGFGGALVDTRAAERGRLTRLIRLIAATRIDAGIKGPQQRALDEAEALRAKRDNISRAIDEVNAPSLCSPLPFPPFCHVTLPVLPHILPN